MHSLASSSSYSTKEYSSDNIIGYSSDIDDKGVSTLVFIGQHFDYMITSGGKSIAAILSSNNINKKNFSAGKGSRAFSGVSDSLFYVHSDNK